MISYLLTLLFRSILFYLLRLWFQRMRKNEKVEIKKNNEKKVEIKKEKNDKVAIKEKSEKGQSSKPTIKSLLIAFFATTAAVFLLLLAGLSLAGTAVASVASMPLFLIFSPVLVPAGITATVIATGLMAGGTSGVTVLTILGWLYKQITGKDMPKIPLLTPGVAQPTGGAVPPASKPTAKPTKPKAKPTSKPAAKPAAKPKK